MAGGSSSLKRKSSSSSHKKRKSSKSSHEVKRKKSRSGNRGKSKKIRHQDVSSYSDDSRSEDSMSTFYDSEDDYRHRKSRSRTRLDTKARRKRVRRSLSSSDEDSMDSPCRRKRKQSKKSDGTEVRKKTHRRKHRKSLSKRGLSVDYSSSDSLSYSNRGHGSSSGESELKGSRGRSKKREKSKRSLRETRKGKNGYGNRSRSCSASSECSERSDSEDKLSRENHSRRLKSVLTVVNRQNEAEIRDQSMIESRDEIFQTYDDIPLCRSDDSYDGGRNKEPSHQTHVFEERWVDDGRIEEASFTRSIKENHGAHLDQKDSTTDVMDSAELGIKGEICTVSSAEGDDLESILRQKALENLKKFRGGLHTNTKAPGDEKGVRNNNVEQLHAVQDESIRDKTCNEVSNEVSGAKTTVASDVKNIIVIPMEKNCTPGPNNKQHESKAKLHASHASLSERKSLADRIVADKDKEEKNTNTFVVNKSNRDTSSIKQDSAPSPTTIKKMPTLPDFPDGKFKETKNILYKNVAGSSDDAPRNMSGPHDADKGLDKGTEPAAPEASSVTSVTEERGSTEPRADAKGGSEFEQKTMSVMRGGEMVQVSYKVYIPKKPPALARRQLRR